MAAKRENGRIVETATEARQAEPGRSVFLILVISLALALATLGALGFWFFRT